MKIKNLFLIIILSVIYGCTYFEVKDAINEANKGNYLVSLENLSTILKENNSNKKAIDAVELIYPQAYKKYSDDILANREYDLKKYTQGMINLLKTQELYFNLPETSKAQMNIIAPPLNKRNQLKKEIAKEFMILGKMVYIDNYISKLKAFGYLESANSYNIDNSITILNTYNEFKKRANGKFFIKLDTNIYPTIAFPLVDRIKATIVSYPLFTVSNYKDSNLIFTIDLSNLIYIPPNTQIERGIDSYTDTQERIVMKKVIEKTTVDGKEIKIEKFIPVRELEDVEVHYQYEKFTKTTSLQIQLSYTLQEKNGNILFKGVHNINVTDKVTWNKYYPFPRFSSIDLFKVPISENEKYTISENELNKKLIMKLQNQIKEVLDSLYSNTTVNLDE